VSQAEVVVTVRDILTTKQLRRPIASMRGRCATGATATKAPRRSVWAATSSTDAPRLRSGSLRRKRRPAAGVSPDTDQQRKHLRRETTRVQTHESAERVPVLRCALDNLTEVGRAAARPDLCARGLAA